MNQRADERHRYHRRRSADHPIGRTWIGHHVPNTRTSGSARSRRTRADLQAQCNRAERTSTLPTATNYRKEKPMFTKSVKRLLVTLGVTAGFVTVAASQASAAMNHSEPTLSRN